MWGLLIGLGGVLLLLAFFGRPAAAGVVGLSEALNRLISFEFRPTIAPTIGLEWTPGIWEWWESAQKWLPQAPGEIGLGLAGIIPEYGTLSDILAKAILDALGQVPGGGVDDTTAGADDGIPLGGVPVPIVSPGISQIQEWLGII